MLKLGEKKKSRKLLSLVLIAATSMNLAVGCSKNDTKVESATQTTVASEKK